MASGGGPAGGDLDEGLDPANLAAFLYATLDGLSALATTGASAHNLEAALAHAFAR